jgi:hypothetical protein
VRSTKPPQLAHDFAVEGGLKLDVEVVEGFNPREPGEPQATLDPALVPSAPFRLQRLGQEPLIVEIALGRLLTDAVELAKQMFHLQTCEEHTQLHHGATSS